MRGMPWPTCDQPCLIGQRITSASTVALQDLFKALYRPVYALIDVKRFSPPFFKSKWQFRAVVLTVQTARVTLDSDFFVSEGPRPEE